VLQCLLVDGGHIPRACSSRKRSYAESSATSSACLPRPEHLWDQRPGANARQAQPPKCCPQRLRHRWMIGKRPKVPRSLRKIERRRIISAGPSSSSEGSTPRSTRNGAPSAARCRAGVTKAQVEPVRALEGDALADGQPTACVGTNTHLARVGCAATSSFSCSRKGSSSCLNLGVNSSGVAAMVSIEGCPDRCGHTP